MNEDWFERRDANMAVQSVCRLRYVCATKVVTTVEKRPAFGFSVQLKERGKQRAYKNEQCINIILRLFGHVRVMNVAFIFVSSLDPRIQCILFVGHNFRMFCFIVTSHLLF